MTGTMSTIAVLSRHLLFDFQNVCRRCLCIQIPVARSSFHAHGVLVCTLVLLVHLVHMASCWWQVLFDCYFPCYGLVRTPSMRVMHVGP